MLKFSKLVEAMMEDIKHSEFSGFDVEVKLAYAEDEEGVLHAYVDDAPTVKFTVQKMGKEVVMRPYYFVSDPADEDNVGN